MIFLKMCNILFLMEVLMDSLTAYLEVVGVLVIMAVMYFFLTRGSK